VTLRPSAENGREPLPIAELILRGSSGDRPALEALIGRYQERVAGFVFAQTNDANHCEDLCQAIFVKMVIALPRLRALDRFEPWLFQIARNACCDHLRARQSWRRLFVAYQPAHESVAVHDPPEGDRREGAVEQGAALLPPEQGDLLRLSLEKQRSYEELARLANTSVAAVKSRLHRARRNLREILLAGDPK
jgi:RNA polymerase sigma-70 factor (ECF subfamily)